ncbi:MAG: SusC/RagA family TonB-linked outer membrane protein [Breznakibacter sp.]
MRKLILSLSLLIGGILTAQSQTVLTGTVIDKNDGQPVVGAAFAVKGTTSGAITDSNGRFRYESAMDTGSIVFMMVGYEPFEQRFNGSMDVTIRLVPDNIGLNEVVVIGYGETRKKDLSTAVSSINLTNQKSRPTDAIGMIQGNLAGVSVTSEGGDPLSGSTIVVRGKGSRYSDEILYIVDGVPGAPFNTDDVESITVLKDAASAAIYGAHVGSGGVFIVTTKKARAGQTKVSANIYRGWQQATNLPAALTAQEYNKVATDAANNGNGVIPGVADAAIYPYGQTTRTDWIDEIFRTASVQNYAVSISGGSEKLNAFSSFEYKKKEGVLLNTFAKNLGAKLNVDYNIAPKLTLSETVNYAYANGQGGVNTSSHTGIITGAMFMPRSAPVYEADGSYSGTVPEEYADLGVAGGYGEVQNPVASLNRLDQYRPSHHIFSTTAVSYKPWPSLTLKSSLSANYVSDRYEDFVPKVPEIGKPNLTNSRSLSSASTSGWFWENTATFAKTFAEKHNLSLMAGFSEGDKTYRSFGLTVYDMEDESESTRSVVNATDWSTSKPSESYWEESQISSFGRLAYSFQDRYFTTASLRYDATSKLPQANNSDIFPAVSGAWKLSSEPFFANIAPSVGLVKFRASWGQIGNVAAVPYYAGSVSLSSDSYITYLGDNAQTAISGVALTTLANPNLKWETSEQTDLGIDLGLLGGRLALSADYFIKKTKDMIDLMPVASVAGVANAPYANIGDTKNTGFELEAGYSSRIGELGLVVNANFTSLKSEVTSIGDQEYIQHSNQIRGLQMLRSTVGQPWHSFCLVRTDGIFQSQEEIDGYTFEGNQIQPNARPGDLKFKDVSGADGKPDGVINDYDRVYCGSYTPDFYYGFNFSFDYKGFDLGLLFQGVSGNKIFNGFKLMTMEGTQGWNMSRDILDSWTYDSNSGIPRVTNTDPNKNYGTSSNYFLEDGSYLRFKNITLGYTVPKSLYAKAGIDQCTLRLYGSIENVAIWTNYSGMDPEVGNYGVDGGRYPVARTISVGLNLNF